MRGSVDRFRESLTQPKESQIHRLRSQLELCASSEWGRSLDLASLLSLSDPDELRSAFQSQVPIHSWEDFTPWVKRLAEEGSLNAKGDPLWSNSPLRFFEPTSGSSSAAKLIPYTEALLEEFRATTDPWLYSMHRHAYRAHNPSGGRAYWSISPALRRERETPGGVRIGNDDDSSYLGPLGRWAMRQLFAVPSSVAQYTALDDWRRETLRALLRAPDLRLLSVWSPSFLGLLFDAFEGELRHLVNELPRSRQRKISAAERLGRTLVEACWPQLRLLSCWVDGAAARDLLSLRRHLPRVVVEPKGLLATEGAISLSWLDPRTTPQVEDGPLGPMLTAHRPLAINSHTLEFIDLDQPETPPRWAEELEIGKTYSPVMTTGGGLMRYELGDLVRCESFLDATPCIIFLGKRYAVSDLRGEKLHASHVADVAQRALELRSLSARFMILLPDQGSSSQRPPRYTLCLDEGEWSADPQGLSEVRELCLTFETLLRENVHYNYARDLGQLDPLSFCLIPQAAQWYLSEKEKSGLRLGDIKLSALDPKWQGDLSSLTQHSITESSSSRSTS